MAGKSWVCFSAQLGIWEEAYGEEVEDRSEEGGWYGASPKEASGRGSRTQERGMPLAL